MTNSTAVADTFVDTNVLIYLFSSDPRKADRAEAVLASGGTVSVQVLNELTHVARRKLGMGWVEVEEVLATIRQLLVVVPLTVEVHDLGLAIAERYRYGLYDSMIVAAALLSDCRLLYSEDMQHGQCIEGLTIRNPFRE